MYEVQILKERNTKNFKRTIKPLWFLHIEEINPRRLTCLIRNYSFLSGSKSYRLYRQQYRLCKGSRYMFTKTFLYHSYDYKKQCFPSLGLSRLFPRLKYCEVDDVFGVCVISDRWHLKPSYIRNYKSKARQWSWFDKNRSTRVMISMFLTLDLAAWWTKK